MVELVCELGQSHDLLGCRLVADVLNDVGKCLELLAPLFPQLFLTLVCAASVSMVRTFHLVTMTMDSVCGLCIVQAIVGSAGIATRAALVQHQARRDNMADVAAKDNSQVAFFMCPLL